MAFTCPQCGMTSHNPNDEANQYCGNCHAFVTTAVFICPLCDQKLETRSMIPSGQIPAPSQIGDALRQVVAEQDKVLAEHLHTHTLVDALKRVRQLQDALDKEKRDACRMLVCVVEAAGGAVAVPTALLELYQPDWALVRWDDPATSSVRFRVHKEVSAER